MAVLTSHAAPPTGPAPGAAGRELPLGPNAALVVTAPDEGPATVTVTGDLDLACAEDLRSVLCSALGEHPPGLRLDLAGVGFFDCAALHALERARHQAEACGRPLVLERSSAAVDLVLRLAASF